jgi:tripartite-type tricarboxylate transporter receptor subunit TctC
VRAGRNDNGRVTHARHRRTEEPMLARLGCAALLAAASLLTPLFAAAQDYPSQPIKVVTPGAATDVIARFITERVTKNTGAVFVIQQIPGANGILAAKEVAKSKPDGYTLFVSSNSAHGANAYLYKDLGYDPLKDFVPVAGFTKNPHVFVIRADLPPKNLKEFIAYAKANPGKINYGTGNTGSLSGAEVLMSLAGIQMTRVSYKTIPAVLTDLLGGRIEFLSTDYFIIADHIRTGTLRALGVTSTTRLKALADIPPVAETVPGYDLYGWTAIYAPAGTSPAIVAKLNKAFNDVLSTPEAEDFFGAQGMQIFVTTPAELGDFTRQQIPMWADILKKAGVERQ